MPSKVNILPVEIAPRDLTGYAFVNCGGADKGLEFVKALADLLRHDRSRIFTSDVPEEWVLIAFIASGKNDEYVVKRQTTLRGATGGAYRHGVYYFERKGPAKPPREWMRMLPGRRFWSRLSNAAKSRPAAE